LTKLRGIIIQYDVGDVVFKGEKALTWYNSFVQMAKFASQHNQNPFDRLEIFGDYFPRFSDGDFMLDLDEKYHKTPKKGEFWFKMHNGKTKILKSSSVRLFHPSNAKISWEERLEKIKSLNKIAKIHYI
jgi:hypothetical protein